MYNNSINVIGLMSGTSLDGVDICLVSFENLDNTKYNIVFAKTFVYSKIWIKKLKDIKFFNSFFLIYTKTKNNRCHIHLFCIFLFIFKQG